MSIYSVHDVSVVCAECIRRVRMEMSIKSSPGDPCRKMEEI